MAVGMYHDGPSQGNLAKSLDPEKLLARCRWCTEYMYPEQETDFVRYQTGDGATRIGRLHVGCLGSVVVL